MNLILQFFVVLVVTEAGIVALSTIPLLQTIITNSGYDATQVWAGIGLAMLVLYSMAFALTWKGK